MNYNHPNTIDCIASIKFGRLMKVCGVKRKDLIQKTFDYYLSTEEACLDCIFDGHDIQSLERETA